MSVILDCFDVKRSTFYRWKKDSKKPEKRDEVVEKINSSILHERSIAIISEAADRDGESRTS